MTAALDSDGPLLVADEGPTEAIVGISEIDGRQDRAVGEVDAEQRAGGRGGDPGDGSGIRQQRREQAGPGIDR